jgi:glutamate/tyrosine decarboxylase-like PLP-dependent enzyme
LQVISNVNNNVLELLHISNCFRALKTWLTIKQYGTRRLGDVITKSCLLAKYLAQRIAEHPTTLQLLAEVTLNIVCFRYVPTCGASDTVHIDGINSACVVAIHNEGLVAPSATRIKLADGTVAVAIRACFINHRNSEAEVDCLIDSVLRIGPTIATSTK